MDDLGSRLETFENWPSYIPVKPKDLGEVGFYYQGYGDAVCCFACGGVYSGWQADDDPEAIHYELYGDQCRFIQERVSSRNNVATQGVCSEVFTSNRFDPIGNDDMEFEEQRLHSFGRNNGWSGHVSALKLAKAGFYFTGIDDNVKCFACDLSLRRWEPEDDPLTEHMKYCPNCPFLTRFSPERETNNSNQSINVMSTSSGFHDHNPPQSYRMVFSGAPLGPIASKPPQQVTNIWQRNQPIRKITSPKYASKHSRLQTFIQWPKECPIRPKDLIDAGFYYTGKDDNVTCFKCGITLAGWVPEDTPWGEHEKWSKDCLLVQEYLSKRHQYQETVSERIEPQEQTWSTPKSSPAHTTFNDQQVCYGQAEVGEEMGGSYDDIPSEKPEKKKDDLKNVSKEYASYRIPARKPTKKELFYLATGVQTLLEQGHDLSTIEEAIKYKTKIQNENIDSLDELLQAVISIEEAKAVDEDYQPHIEEIIDSPTPDITLPFNLESLNTHEGQVKDVNLCKICLDAEKGVLFLPCKHIICCPNCASKIQSKSPSLCPVCRVEIQSTIRTYLT